MTTLARMQYHQRQAFQADSDEDAAMNAPGPNNPDTRYAADDDGLDGLDADEAEQERLLSEQFGEAGEAPAEKRKTTTDQDIAAELAGEVRRAKKSRPTLQPSDLVGPSGLNRIKNEFNDQVRYRGGADRARLRAKKGGSQKKLTRDQLKRAELNAAAAYSRDLVGAYRSFCRDLFPPMAFEDTVSRIESLGSKKEVKDYVEVMREDVRRQHLVKIYGAAKTDRMLSELESNLVGGAEGYGDDGDGQQGAAAAAVVNPYGAAATNTASGASNAPVVQGEEEEEEVPPASPTRDYRGVTRFSQRANPYAPSEPTPADKNAGCANEEEEEEEVEASFDEDVAPTGDAAAFSAAGEADEQDQNDGEAQEKDDEEEELEFVDAAPKEKESTEDISVKSIQENNDDHHDEDEDEEQLFFDATQPSQEDASPKELLGQETPSPQSTPEDSTPPSSAEKAAQAPVQEEQQQEQEESEVDLPETEAFGMPNDMNMMEEDIPTQHVAHDDDGGEGGDDSEELVMDATQETLTNVLPTMTAPDADENGEGEEGAMSQMSLEY